MRYCPPKLPNLKGYLFIFKQDILSSSQKHPAYSLRGEINSFKKNVWPVFLLLPLHLNWLVLEAYSFNLHIWTWKEEARRVRRDFKVSIPRLMRRRTVDYSTIYLIFFWHNESKTNKRERRKGTKGNRRVDTNYSELGDFSAAETYF